jgi:ATP-dependent Zn protease
MGHAIVGKFLQTRINIIRLQLFQGSALGLTAYTQKKNQSKHQEQDYLEKPNIILLGGRSAEKILFNTLPMALLMIATCNKNCSKDGH